LNPKGEVCPREIIPPWGEDPLFTPSFFLNIGEC
jgi:hypothetical protein